METSKKVELLSEKAKYDLIDRSIYPSSLSNGKTFPILKILMDNACHNNCRYCLNSQGGRHQTVSLRPEELANVFIRLVRNNSVNGLFLSSGLSYGANEMMEKMIKACEIIRERYKFSGYIHLKILPGVDLSYVERAVELANRVSLNLEAPNPVRLKEIAPKKEFNKLLATIKRISSLILKKPKTKSQTTQFVVGAAGETDYEILKCTSWLYKGLRLSRVYFSAFRPIPDTPLEDHPPTPPIRQYRLYQADWLLRQYGFELSEIVFNSDGNLPERYDPKMCWALNHKERFPIEVNTATYSELLKVPGIGIYTAKRIITLRKRNRFHTFTELKSTGILQRAIPFILTNGKLYKRLGRKERCIEAVLF